MSFEPTFRVLKTTQPHPKALHLKPFVTSGSGERREALSGRYMYFDWMCGAAGLLLTLEHPQHAYSFQAKIPRMTRVCMSVST